MRKTQAAIHPDDDFHYNKLGLTRNKVELWEDGMRTDGSRCTFDAPVILVVCYDRNRDWKNKLQPGYESGETDAAIVCTHMMLQAFELGIGSCWVGYFNASDVADALGLPENLTVSALLPIGYPAENAQPAPLHTQYREFRDTIEVI